MAILVQDYFLVGIVDVVVVVGVGGLVFCVVVLCVFVDIVERFGIIDCDFVELCQWQVFYIVLGSVQVKIFVDVVVCFYQQVVGVRYFEGYGVVVFMFGCFVYIGECFVVIF